VATEVGDMSSKVYWMASLLTGLACICLWAAESNQEKFAGRLSLVPLDPAKRNTITGQGSVMAVLTGSRLSIHGSFEDLGSPATVARLHHGRITGLRGFPVFDLTVTHAVRGTVDGSFDLNPNQIEELRKGEFYLQLHSEKAPDGNLWGWLLPQGGPGR
jgi:CHRD domain